LDSGKVILREKRGDEVISTLTAKGSPVFKDIETVVLINEGSASASEITAGALKDHQVGLVIGTKSYGKGSVQQVIDLSGGGSIKITIARWFTPNDKNIDKEGIEPDKKVERTIDDIAAGRDPQLDAAKTELR
jgi:carboxyl-terminal processing protease